MTPPEIKMFAVTDLRPYERNPKTHPDDQVEMIVRSINEFGWTTPVLIDNDNNVIAGHGRLLAADKIGMTEVPTIRIEHLTPEQVRAYRIADNRLTELGGWDTADLIAELDALKMDDFDVELTGFSLEDLARMKPPDEAANETPEPPETPVTQEGDIWTLGRHRIICGDSTDADTVKLLLNGNKPNLMVTDPPYGVQYDAEWRDSAANSGAIGTIDPYPVSTGKVVNDHTAEWSKVIDAHSECSVVYLWGPSLSVEFASILTGNQYDLRSCIIWRKPNFVISRGHYHWQHENLWYGVKRGQSASWKGDRRQSTIWDIPSLQPMGRSQDEADGSTGHSTQKPVECMERPIRNHAGDVYDPFVGSGTTVIASERQERRCYAVEINPAYCDVTVERWENYTGGKAKRN